MTEIMESSGEKISEAFEPYIKKVKEHIRELKGERGSGWEKKCSSGAEEIDKEISVQFGEKFEDIILREDTFVELGGPKTTSSASVPWTDNLKLVEDGLITLVGPDIQGANDGFLPLGQMVILGIKEFEPSYYGKFKENQYVDNLEGYMVKAVPQRRRIWSRISKEAVEKGFTFETLGRALLTNFKRIPKVEKVEVIFVTSSEDDVREFSTIAGEVWDIWQGRTEGEEKPKTTAPKYDCTTCPNRETCEEIWEILQIKKGVEAGEKPAILCADDELSDE